MQLYADVLGRPVSLAASTQGAALGSAIHAAVAAGAYPDVPTGAKTMGRLVSDAYKPDLDRHDEYDALYDEYRTLHDYFGLGDREGGNDVLHRLRRLRNGALAR
jgi:L-ribulokinase